MGEDCGLQASQQGYRTGRVFLALTKHGNGSGSTGFKERYCIGNTLGKGVTSSLGSAAWAKQIDILGGGFKHFLFSPHLGKIPILTNFFAKGLEPPTSIYIYINLLSYTFVQPLFLTQQHWGSHVMDFNLLQT